MPTGPLQGYRAMRRPPICDAIRTAVTNSGLTQEAVANALGEKQQTISGWMNRREPKLDDLVRLEEVLEKPAGYLLRMAGYVDEVVDTFQCITADPHLTEPHRELLLASYDAARALSARAKALRIRKTAAEKSIKRSSS